MYVVSITAVTSTLKWEEVSQKGDVPTPREGHIFWYMI